MEELRFDRLVQSPAFALGTSHSRLRSVVVIVDTDLLWSGLAHRVLRNEEGWLEIRRCKDEMLSMGEST